MSLGFKVEIERALDTLAAQGTDPAIALIARAKQKFENCLLAFQGYGEIPYTMYSPRTWYDANDDEGWIVSRKENLYVAMARSVSLGRGERPENMWSNLFTRSLWFGLCCVGCLFCFVWGVFWLGFFIVLFTSHH